jgi:hypothetical protein
MKYAFCEKTTKDKLEPILVNFRPKQKTLYMLYVQVPVIPREDRMVKNLLMLYTVPLILDKDENFFRSFIWKLINRMS